MGALLLGLVLLAFVGDARGAWEAHREAQDAALRARVVLQLTEATQARLALGREALDSLSLVREARDSLQGEVLAALAIRTKPDTVIVYDSTSQTHFDSTQAGVRRMASLTDTTDTGIEVTVRAEAPADQAKPLGLGYDLFVPSFRPEIAFIDTDLGVFATVSWLGQEFEVEAPFYRTKQENPNPLQLQVGSRLLAAQAGGVPSIDYDLYGQLAYYTSPDTKVAVPIGIKPGGTYFGITLERTIFRMPSLRNLLPF